MKIDSRLKPSISFLVFLVSLITSFSLGEIFYNSIDGTDFYRYFRYIEYFEGSLETPSREQGLFYFMYISYFIEAAQAYYVPELWEFIYSTAIQAGNFLLYLFGLLGLYLWLVDKKIDKNNIFLSFAMLNFFPPLFGGRLIMKPEILAFAFIPWILIGLDQYFENKKLINLFLTTPLVAVLVTSKGTIAFLLVSSLVYIYFKLIKEINLFDFSFSAAFFIALSLILYFENLNINSVSLFFHPELDQYLFKAPLSFLYNINASDLINNPFRNQHANSLIGITFIDIFGDYFNRYWDHSRSLFIMNREDLFSFLPHPRRNIGLVLSVIFVSSSILFKNNSQLKKYKRIYLIGIFVLGLTSLGLFGLHFNPSKGDTLKTHYYFYLLAISFLILAIEYFSGKKYILKITTVVLFFLISMFIYGFPKDYNSEYLSSIGNKLPTTISCKLTSIYFDNISGNKTQCLNKDVATCGYYDQYSKPVAHEDGYLIFQNDEFFTPLNLIDDSGYTVTVNGYAECLNYVQGGYYLNNDKFLEDRTPFANNLVLYLSLASILGLIITKNKKFKIT